MDDGVQVANVKAWFESERTSDDQASGMVVSHNNSIRPKFTH
jgi:hypothetical protein